MDSKSSVCKLKFLKKLSRPILGNCDEVTDFYKENHSEQAHENILERQTDLKHLLSLFQDLEIIKRVLFQERHLV